MFIGVYNKSVILTYLGLAFSVVGMVFAFQGFVSTAVMCLVFSGVCDMFDGTVARSCKRNDREKRFGVQIDSLVDAISFGVFPVILGICMGFTSRINILIYIFYAISAVIRLAFFNVLDEERKSSYKKENKISYYYGLPVTSIAIILPFIYNLKLYSSNIFDNAYPLMMLFVAILFILNIKIKKPTRVWYVIFSILAVIQIAIISSVIF